MFDRSTLAGEVRDVRAKIQVIEERLAVGPQTAGELDELECMALELGPLRRRLDIIDDTGWRDARRS